MLRVTVELIPYGIGKPRKLGVLEIANDGRCLKSRRVI